MSVWTDMEDRGTGDLEKTEDKFKPVKVVFIPLIDQSNFSAQIKGMEAEIRNISKVNADLRKKLKEIRIELEPTFKKI